MNNQNIAYLRVSSVDQNLSRQQEAMASVEMDKVFTEKTSAKDTNRPMLASFKAFLILSLSLEEIGERGGCI